MMMRTAIIALFVVCLLLGGSSALASPVQVSFSALPSSVSGGAGSTVGWGYSISNDTSNWLLAQFINFSTPAQSGSFDFTIFDYPFIAPHTTVTLSYNPAGSGLAQFTWSSSAAPGTVNAGSFLLEARLFSDMSGKIDLGPVNVSAPYSVSLSPVPELPSLVLVGFGLACLLLVRKLA